MKLINWLAVLLGVFGLIGVRFLESQLFYDPFLNYFHEANRHASFPTFDWGKLVISHFFRFGLNVLFSALIVQFMFRNKQWTLQAVLLMLIVFAITFPLYLYCVYTRFEVGYLFSFYMRRFVIQPLVVLLIIPIFYYRKVLREREN